MRFLIWTGFIHIFMDNRRLDRYIEHNSSALPKVLNWLERETNLRTNHSRMLSGKYMAHLLITLSKIITPMRILEIGTFTGYSAICLAQGLKEGGHLDTLEINDELRELIVEAFDRANLSQHITLHLGDAFTTFELLKDNQYDMVYIDANKRDYCAYYDAVLPMVRTGGLILADNVLWDGKVLQDPLPLDAQTQQIDCFNRKINEDHRVENFILPLRDGLNIIRKK